MTVTINGDRYRAMLNEFLFTKMEEENTENTWLQQDGVTCHTAEDVLVVLRPVFENRFINRRASIVCPLVHYIDKSETIDALKDNIREAIDKIRQHTIGNVIKNWTDRLGYCIASRGSHLNEIIFYY